MERLGCRDWHEPACPPKKLGFYSVTTEGRGIEGFWAISLYNHPAFSMDHSVWKSIVTPEGGIHITEKFQTLLRRKSLKI